MENIILDPAHIKHIATVLGLLMVSTVTASGVTRLIEFVCNLYRH